MSQKQISGVTTRKGADSSLAPFCIPPENWFFRLLELRSVLSFGFEFLGWGDYGGYVVVGVEVEEFYA